ncbi:MAG: hypothetical protein HPY76_00230 [Anaerolineae bacterium]|jgi:3-methyladenine DNA glycosylase/8-oxoguanine DNA glycosylase|nr:hypothetical protein [Anaerolineae bacterium]
MRIELKARPPFVLRHVIFSHGWAQLVPFTFQEEPLELRTVDELPGGTVTALTITPADGGVAVTSSASLNAAQQDEIASRVSWMLGLDMDFSPFYQLTRSEPKLAHVEPEGRGRFLRCPTLFEDLVKTIFTTNTQWGATKGMTRRLVEAYGNPLPEDPALKAFPTPEKLAGVDAAELKDVVRCGYRAPYVVELAQRIAGGDLALEAFKNDPRPTAEVRKALLGIKGVGAYAAANLLMLLGRYDHIPVDTWALSLVSQEFHGGQPVGKAEVEAAFAHWDAWQGLAYWLWKYDSQET